MRLVKRIFVDTSVILCCCYACVLSILEYCSPVWLLTAECHTQLFERLVYSVVEFFPNQSFLLLCHRRHVAGLYVCCSRLIQTQVTVCSPSFLLRLPEFDIPKLGPQLIHWSLKYQGVEHPNLLGVSCRPSFECGMTFLTVFDTGTLDGFKGVVNRWLLPCVVCSSVFRGADACGVAKAFYEQFCF